MCGVSVGEKVAIYIVSKYLECCEHGDVRHRLTKNRRGR